MVIRNILIQVHERMLVSALYRYVLSHGDVAPVDVFERMAVKAKQAAWNMAGLRVPK